MSEELSRIADALAAIPSEPVGPPRFGRAVTVWVVGVDEDGAVMAWEVPQPESVTVETQREEHPPDLHRPLWLQDRVLPGFGPFKLRITVDGFDADKHPSAERPDPLYVVHYRPPRRPEP